ncbi:MAG: ComF family protein [Bacteroidota bacterium]
MEILKKFGRAAVKFALSGRNLLFPEHCYVCGEKIPGDFGQIVCLRCRASLPVPESREQTINRLAEIHGFDNLNFIDAFCLFSPTDEFPFERLIYALKYGGVTKIGQVFGAMLGELVKQNTGVKYDFVVPVPIHPAKKRERGYNQSVCIARAVSEAIGSNLELDIARRKEYTFSQTKLSARDRIFNVKNIFEVVQTEKVKNKVILLVDDVLTTGSTLNSLAGAFLDAGARRIDVAALMRA